MKVNEEEATPMEIFIAEELRKFREDTNFRLDAFNRQIMDLDEKVKNLESQISSLSHGGDLRNAILESVKNLVKTEVYGIEDRLLLEFRSRFKR